MILQANKISVRKVQISDDTINFRTLHVIEAGEQRKLPNLVSRYSPSASHFPLTKLKILGSAALCWYNSKTSFAGYHMINVRTHLNRIHAAVTLVLMQAPPQPEYDYAAVVTAL